MQRRRPSDELDSARALSDVETNASLIERVEERLRAIDSALNLPGAGPLRNLHSVWRGNSYGAAASAAPCHALRTIARRRKTAHGMSTKERWMSLSAGSGTFRRKWPKRPKRRVMST